MQHEPSVLPVICERCGQRTMLALIVAITKEACCSECTARLEQPEIKLRITNNLENRHIGLMKVYLACRRKG